MTTIPSPAERAIRRRIARHGPITFAEFMAAALYGPGGYYTHPAAGSDYYTGPRIHPAFGALLAVQLVHLWTLLERPDPFNVLEPGGGDGLLCRDILTASRHLPGGFGDAIRYTVIDPYPASGWETGLPNAGRVVADILSPDLSSLPSPVHCVLSNELLDAMPVHQVRMEGGRLRELYVAIESDVADGYEGALVELPAEPSTPDLESRLSDLGITLADGQTAEICLLLDVWAGVVASMVDCGFVLILDYGRAAADLYDPALRPQGTLVTYRAHRQTDAPLLYVGRQDITAQVDFTSAQRAGETAGLATVGNVPQGWFLQRLGLQTIRRNAPPVDAGGPPLAGWITLPVGPNGLPPETLPDALQPEPDDTRAWRTNLTHLAQPGGLGDFRVLLQAKGVSQERAAAALSWLDGQPAGHGYTPSSLAAMIPPDMLALGPERIRLTQ
ncbi:MAG: SAM-dependent methyltransferase [Chloroflexota bacterium]|nr:SAM-dependent methyltransferase [Chloroflexota bacterium]MDE2684715.1 SAM-dependent methyltransferase [Chloroflexota bacterium]